MTDEAEKFWSTMPAGFPLLFKGESWYSDVYQHLQVTSISDGVVQLFYEGDEHTTSFTEVLLPPYSVLLWLFLEGLVSKDIIVWGYHNLRSGS